MSLKKYKSQVKAIVLIGGKLEEGGELSRRLSGFCPRIWPQCGFQHGVHIRDTHTPLWNTKRGVQHLMLVSKMHWPERSQHTAAILKCKERAVDILGFLTNNLGHQQNRTLLIIIDMYMVL